MTVLVAGGAGYIGSHTVTELMSRGFDVVIADDFRGSSRKTLQGIEAITGKRCLCWEGDLRDYDSVSAAFSQWRPETVINFAAYKSIGESVEEPLKYYDNNLRVMINLCRAMEEHRAERMIFSSSATVYGSGRSPMDEECQASETLNPYGETKKICERILMDFNRAHPSKDVCILRYFNPVGAHSSGLIGESSEGRVTNLMPLICRTAAGKAGPLKVYGQDYPTPDGTGVRDYIHVADVAAGHVAAMSFLKEHKGVHVFNLGTGRGISVLEMIKAFERVNRVKVPYKVVSRRPGDVAECYASVEKAENVLGWRARLDIEDMVRDAWRFETMEQQAVF